VPVLWTRWSLLNWRMKQFVPMLHQGSQWARLEDMESRFVWCFCTGDWAEHMKLCTFISYSVLLSWLFLWKVSKANSTTCIMVLVLFYRELGALLWRELKVASSMLWDSLYTGTLPCHLQSGWEPQHVMQSFWPNRGELLSGALKRSLMQIIKQ